MGRVRAAAGRAPARRLRARDLRHVGEGAARDPEQGVPGARVRHAARHRRHAGRARAARRRRERAARAARRPARRSPRRCAGSRRTASLARRLAAGGLRRLRGARERSGARRALARAARRRSRVRSGRGAALDRDRRVRRRLRARSRSCATARSTTGRFDLGNMVQAVWSTAHGHPLADHDLRGEQVSRLGAHFDPILAALRAALVDLAEPGPAARRAGDRDRARRAARLLARAQAPRLERAGARLRARVPRSTRRRSG